MQYIILLGRDRAADTDPPARVYRPGEPAGLGVKPFTSQEPLRAWVADMKARGVKLLYEGGGFSLWGHRLQDLVRVEANFDLLLKTFLPHAPKPKAPARADEPDPGCNHAHRLFAVEERRTEKAPPPALDALPPKVERLDPATPLRACPLAFVDTETTGLYVGKGDRIVEIAICRVGPGGASSWLVSLFNPERDLPEGAAKVNKLTQEILDASPLYKEEAENILQALSGAVFVAHNAEFDVAFVEAEQERAGVPWQAGDVIDTVELSRRLLPGRKSYSLAALASSLGFPPGKSHRAREDVLTLKRLWDHLLRGLPEGVTLGDLYKILDGTQAAPGERYPLPYPCPACRGGEGLLTPKGPHRELSCAGCGKYIKFLSKEALDKPPPVPKRGPESDLEEWAGDLILALDEEGKTFAPDSFGESLARWLRDHGALSDAQWERAVPLALRFKNKSKIPPPQS